MLNRRVKETKVALGPLEHQFRILGLLDIELKDKKIELWPSKDDARYIEEFLDSQWINKSQPLAGLHLGSSRKWLTQALAVGLCRGAGREAGFKGYPAGGYRRRDAGAGIKLF